jgi:anti-anti-sigma factor
MLLKFWGTRGTIPSPLRPDQVEQKLKQILKMAAQAQIALTDPGAIETFLAEQSLAGSTVGSNTTCVTVELENDLIIFDAGSGIRELGEALMDKQSDFAQKFRFYQGKGHASIFFTHTHWDHIQGFPFFRPLNVTGNIFDIYHVHDYVPTVLARQMEFEYCPYQFDQIDATTNFHKIEEGQQVIIGDAVVDNIELNHPGKAYAYRVAVDDAIAILATDSEYTNLDYAETKKYRDFYANADALIFDAMYSVRESFIREDWGHSSALIGADLARVSNVKRLFLFHHDPTNTDEEITQVLRETKEYLGASEYPKVFVAQDGMEVFLDNSAKSADFDMQDRVEGAVILITLSGHFGPQVTDRFRKYLDYSLRTHHSSKVVLKMENLNSMTMAGIRALVDARKSVLSLALVGVPDRVYRVIELSGTTDFFAIYEDEAAALAALNAHYR